jgi:hypothetical protein
MYHRLLFIGLAIIIIIAFLLFQLLMQTDLSKPSKPLPLPCSYGRKSMIELFANPRPLSDENKELSQWQQIYNNARTSYLNNLIRADYIQMYPWMASNPNGATSYNNRLFIQSSDPVKYNTHPLDYYDYGELTYIGNPL